jgi:hypothetical protein
VQPADLACALYRLEQVAVAQPERLEPTNSGREGNGLVRTGKVKGGKLDPRGLDGAQTLGAPAVDERPHIRLALSETLRHARWLDREPPRALDERPDPLDAALAATRGCTELAQVDQPHAFMRAAMGERDLLRGLVQRRARRDQRAAGLDEGAAFVAIDAAEAAGALDLGAMMRRVARKRFAVDRHPRAAVVHDPVCAESAAAPALQGLRGDAELLRQLLEGSRAAIALVARQLEPLREIEDQRREIGDELTAWDDLRRKESRPRADDGRERLRERVVGAWVYRRNQCFGRQHPATDRLPRIGRRPRGNDPEARKGVGRSARHGSVCSLDGADTLLRGYRMYAQTWADSAVRG